VLIDYGVNPASHGREPAAAAASRTCDAVLACERVGSALAEPTPQTPATRLRRVAGTPLKRAAGFAGARGDRCRAGVVGPVTRLAR